MDACMHNTYKELTHMHAGTFSASEQKLQKSMSEIRGGVTNVLGKGDSGKSGADGACCVCMYVCMYVCILRV